LDLTTASQSREEYEAARLECLQRAFGFEALYVGAAEPEDPVPEPSVSGVNQRVVASCERHADRYWGDRLRLNAAAARAGGAVCDQEAFSATERDRMPFYHEVITQHGISAIGLSVLKLHGVTMGCAYFGRTARGARFGDELSRLKPALSVLALGKKLYELPLRVTGTQLFAPPLTEREQDVLWHLTRGSTNAQIAARLGTSPSTVKNQVSSILAKAGVGNRTELVYLATRSTDSSALRS
jgi:DNA-binding CsgD family transcriptional regulator